jgi:hypothetical protein
MGQGDVADAGPVGAGWGSPVVGVWAWVVALLVGEVVGVVVGVIAGPLVGKLVAVSVGVADGRGGTVVVVLGLGRITGGFGISPTVGGLAGRVAAGSGRTRK